MSAQLAAHGRLGGDPRAIETKTGRAMATATLAVDAAGKREGDDAAPLWLGLVAFGTLAERLLEQRKGDALTVYGRLQVRRWESDGEAREQLQVVVETILSARTAVRREGGHIAPRAIPRRSRHELSQTDRRTRRRACHGVKAHSGRVQMSGTPRIIRG